jgi:DNA-binding SARP family transcriptional activator
MLEVRLFGHCQVRTPHGFLTGADFGVRQRHIFQLLALHRRLSRAGLAELLWAGRPPAGYAATLDGYVGVLRRRLDPVSDPRASAVVGRAGGYELDEAQVRVDLWHFDHLLAQADALAAPAAFQLLARAVNLAAAPLLRDDSPRGEPPRGDGSRGDVPRGDAPPAWAVEARLRHEARLVTAAVRVSWHALQRGDLRTAEAFARRAAELDPQAEAAGQVRLAVLRAEGDRVTALRGYRQGRQSWHHDEPATDFGQAASAVPATDFGQAASAVLATARELAGPHERAATLDERAVQLVARAEQIMAGMHLPCAITPRVPPGGAW